MELCDLHIHSKYSFDGEAEVSDMCAAAVQAGLSAVAFTEHWDAFPGRDGEPYYMEYDAIARTAVMDARERYSGRLKVLYGIELGQPHHTPAASRGFMAGHDFDFAVGSVHFDASGLDYYFLDYFGTEIDRLLTKYYEEHLKMIAFGGFTTVGHLDYPVRVLSSHLRRPPTMLPYRDVIAEVLRAAVRGGIFIEINTNGLRNWYHRLSPEPWVLRLYRDLGGRHITIGSDAHSARQVGTGVREAAALAEACGLEHAACF